MAAADIWSVKIQEIEINLIRLVNKEERIKKFKSLSSFERQKLILMKMRAKGIEVGSGVPNKIYNNEEIYELIHIAKSFKEFIKE